MGCAGLSTNTDILKAVPVKSFVLVKKITKANVCAIPATHKRIKAKQKYMCHSAEFSFDASGVIARHDKRNNKTYILTAKHFCSLKNESIDKYTSETWNKYFTTSDFRSASKRIEVQQKIAIYDINGYAHKSEIYSISENSDICLLKTEHINYPNILISDTPPAYGQSLWNISAPHGIFIPKIAPILKGIYSGKVRHRGEPAVYMITDLPAVPGSSGSPMFNHRGELVGIVQSTIIKFPHISYAVSLEEVQRFLWSNFH